jgi:uncharacterized protein
METYRVVIAELLDSLGTSMVVSDTFVLPALDVGDEHFDVTAPVPFDVTITNTGTAVIAYGTVNAPVVATCARCLCEFPTVIEGAVEGFYVFPGQDTDIPEEQDVEYVDADGAIDLMPAIMAAIVLETPFAPLHDEECAGICGTCGADLNSETCSCDDAEEDDHPFAALKALVTEEDSEG